MGALLTDLLQRAQRSRRVVSIQTSHGLYLGYILSHNPELLVLRSLTRQGLPTGVRTIGVADISQVHFDDRYVRLIEFKEHHPDIVYGVAAAPAGLEQSYLSVPALLRQAHETRQLVQLETAGDARFYGYVERLTDDELLLQVYTAYGEADGHTVMRLDDVSSIIWSDEETRSIELLVKSGGLPEPPQG